MESIIGIDSLEQKDTLESKALSQQLATYRQLRRKEKKLRARVSYLEKKAAFKGPLAVEVDLAITLQEEESELETLRGTLTSLEERFKDLKALPEEQRTVIEADQLERLVGDLRTKREQMYILQENINYLEEMKAHFGFDVPLNLANELKLARESLEKVQMQLQTLERRLIKEWNFDPVLIPNLDKMAEPQLLELAAQVITRKKSLVLEQAKQRRKGAAEKYEGLVMETLEDLRKAVYPDPESHVGRTTENEWGIYFTGSFGGVSVRLEFDRADNPVFWRCTRSDYDGRVVREARADLSRDSLIAALRALHRKEKKWWQFWYRPPVLPEGWE